MLSWFGHNVFFSHKNYILKRKKNDTSFWAILGKWPKSLSEGIWSVTQGVRKVWAHSSFHYLFYLFRLFFLPIGFCIEMMMALSKKNESSLYCWMDRKNGPRLCVFLPSIQT